MSKIKESFDCNNIFFTSDTHFFHDNIIKYCSRPFKDAEEMNNVIATNWNKKVSKDGIVFILGDVSLNSKTEGIKWIFETLNFSKLYLIKGNHEKDVLRKQYIREYFESIDDILEITVKDEEISHGEQYLVMCHYKMAIWNHSHRGSWHLHGHSHGLASRNNPNSLDVGVDCHNFTPLSYSEVKEVITKQNMELR